MGGVGAEMDGRVDREHWIAVYVEEEHFRVGFWGGEVEDFFVRYPAILLCFAAEI